MRQRNRCLSRGVSPPTGAFLKRLVPHLGTWPTCFSPSDSGFAGLGLAASITKKTRSVEGMWKNNWEQKGCQNSTAKKKAAICSERFNRNNAKESEVSCRQLRWSGESGYDTNASGTGSHTPCQRLGVLEVLSPFLWKHPLYSSLLDWLLKARAFNRVWEWVHQWTWESPEIPGNVSRLWCVHIFFFSGDSSYFFIRFSNCF